MGGADGGDELGAEGDADDAGPVTMSLLTSAPAAHVLGPWSAGLATLAVELGCCGLLTAGGQEVPTGMAAAALLRGKAAAGVEEGPCWECLLARVGCCFVVSLLETVDFTSRCSSVTGGLAKWLCTCCAGSAAAVAVLLDLARGATVAADAVVVVAPAGAAAVLVLLVAVGAGLNAPLPLR